MKLRAPTRPLTQAASLLATMVLATACGVVVTPVPVSVIPTGTLSLDWTVDGRNDDRVCDSYQVTDLEATIYDDEGVKLATRLVRCSDFSLTTELAEGFYDTEVILLDGNQRVSTVLRLDGRHVIADTDLTSAIDFPRTSLL